MLRLVLVIAAFLPLSLTSFGEENWTVIDETTWDLNHPNGFGERTISRELSSKELRITFYHGRSFRCNSSLELLQVDHGRSVGTVKYRPKNGRVTLESVNVESIRMDFYTARVGECKIIIESQAAPSVSESEFFHVGEIEYEGSTAEFAINVASKEWMSAVFLEVPLHCRAQVKIDKVGTTTEGVYDPATSLIRSQNIYKINEGRPMRISEVVVGLSGQPRIKCRIGVYVRQGESDPSE